MPFKNTGLNERRYADAKIEEAFDAVTAADIPTSDDSDVQTKLTSYATTLGDHTTQLDAIAYILKESDNLQSLLDAGVRNIRLDPSKTYSINNVVVPNGTHIDGCGATIKSPDTSAPILRWGDIASTSAVDISIDNIKFRGHTDAPDNAAYVATDCGVRKHAAAGCRVTRCSFENFLGIGLSVDYYPTDPAIAKEDLRNTVLGNIFRYCYIGFANWDYAEYGIFAYNIVDFCRIGVWSQSGNWKMRGNLITKCRAPFVSSQAINDLIPTRGGNLQHGDFSGNSVNHGRSDQPGVGWKTANYLLGGVDYQGVWIDGGGTCIPPTFGGNTVYYTDINYTNASGSGMPFWVLYGCVLSQMRVTCDQPNKMALVGCTEQGGVFKTNVSNHNRAEASTVPSDGSYSKGDRIRNSDPSPGEYEGWVATSEGTLGTLNGGSTTGSIATGSTTLVLSSTTGVSVGVYITIAGVSGVKRVIRMSGSNAVLDIAADATVTSAAVAYSPGVLKGYGLIEP